MVKAVTQIGWTVLACWLAYGQAAASASDANARLEFEVATIKPAAPQGPGRMMIGMRGGPGTDDPGRITLINLSLQDVLMDAYNVKRSQISGGPSWLDTERFDITAKVPHGATKEQAKVMMQNLLADRFHLAVHRETKEMAMYALLVAKGGPKLKESAAGQGDANPPENGPLGKGDAPPPPPPMPPPGMMGGRGRPPMGADGCPEVPPQAGNHPRSLMMISPKGACMLQNNQTMAGLADMLSNEFDRPVTDMTGLTGKYDFHLRFDPASAGGRMGGMMRMGPPPGAMMADGPGGGPGGGAAGGPSLEPQEAAPTIFAALQEQLGLRLEARKGPAELLVIDHIEKTPTEN